MTEQNTRNPERFLELIKKSRKGKFKIYIGMIAGVGKTYRMLEETKNLLLVGYNAVIGYIETHGREDTERLLLGLPLVPRKSIFYKGMEIEEMDLQSILNMRPEIVIVDELAHTNAPGSKNSKRWQDVMDLLDAGINVISAINIQHIEGLYGEIEQIAGIKVKERIPDKVLQMADEIINIDLSADELIVRLKEGKIYKQDKIEIALQNFFQPDKILQLRELALKEVAGQVERKIENEVFEFANKRKPEKFLACVSTNYLNARKIIRKTSRMANFYASEWYVLYVQTSGESVERVNLASHRHLINNLKLATELGGEIIKIKSNDIPETIYNITQEKQISTILMGLPTNSVLELIFRGNILRKLLKKIKGSKMDLILVT